MPSARPSALSRSAKTNGSGNTRANIVWRPQYGPQKALLDCALPEVFFGGARGGGKTDGVLGKWALKEARYGAAFNAIMFRRTKVSSEDAIERSREIYGALGGRFNEGKLTWRMPHGGRIGFAYLDGVKDADEYQGRNVTDAWVEEAGQYPQSVPIDRLFGILRSAHGVPTQLILTANPGGAGQGWLRERYQLVPFPRAPQIVTREVNGASIRMAVIPSRISDNKILLHGDPLYVTRLKLVGGKKLVQAWLDGDWNAIEGAFFNEWDEQRHVVEPFVVPPDWLRFRSADWGSASPFSIGWWTVAGDGLRTGAVEIPRGALIRYREWYGCAAGQANTGIKLAAEAVGAGIAERERGETVSYGVLDPAAFAEDGGPSIAERVNGRLKQGRFRAADNTRVSQRGALGGWDMMRARLAGDVRMVGEPRAVRELGPGGASPALTECERQPVPMLFVFSTCRDFIRTVPQLQHDMERPEDLDSSAEDHIADECRYACMSRPWLRAQAEPAQPATASGYRAAHTDAEPGDWKAY
jgi:terminase large subunit-like protein